MKSQILRFNLPSGTTISHQAFTDLRQALARAGAQRQYFGYSISRPQPVPKRRHEITWILRKSRLLFSRAISRKGIENL